MSCLSAECLQYSSGDALLKAHEGRSANALANIQSSYQSRFSPILVVPATLWWTSLSLIIAVGDFHSVHSSSALNLSSLVLLVLPVQVEHKILNSLFLGPGIFHMF